MSQRNESASPLNLELYRENNLYRRLICTLPVLKYQSASAVNAVKHGMNLDFILPCRAASCYYRPVCPLIHSGFSCQQAYSSPCPWEVGLFLCQAEGLSKEFAYRQNEPGLADHLLRLIMVQIKLQRLSAIRALRGGEFPRPGVPEWNYKGMDLSYRYGLGLHEKMNTILTTVYGN